MHSISYLTLFALAFVSTIGAQVRLPHTFKEGEPAVAEEVNANFTVLTEAFNDILAKAGEDRPYVMGSFGIGTENPAKQLEISNSEDAWLRIAGDSDNDSQERGNAYLQFTTDAGNEKMDGLIYLENLAGHTKLHFDVHGRLAMTIHEGNVGIGTKTPSYPLQMKSGAHCTKGGVWTNASSIKHKENIADLSAERALEALEGLNPVTFNYKTDKDEQYIGFIAEEVPDIVATQDREGLSPMDIVAVLTKIVQEQQNTIAELKRDISELKEK